MIVRVGGGTGDPDLLTVRAAQLLAEADVVVVAEEALSHLVPPGRLVEVGGDATDRPGQLVVHLVAGDGVTLPTRADAATAVRPDDVVPGVAAGTDRLALEALRDRAAARPLAGWKVVVTRAAEQVGGLAKPLRRLGASVVELPTIRIDPPADGGAALAAALDRLASFDWLVVTSVNGARAVLDRLPDARRLAGVRLAAIGPATAAALAGGHLPPDLVPPRFVAESLLEVFPPGPGRVLLARAAVARDVLPAGLAAAGWEVEVTEAYRTATPPLPAGRANLVAGADVACFTAPSTFDRFVELLGVASLPPHLACIGPVTAAAVRRAGLEPAVEAAVHTMDGLVAALVDWVAAGGASPPAGPDR